MAENPHYKELLQLLNEFEVDYLIVGGFAIMKYGEPRYTKDLDVWVHNSPHNSAWLVGALKKFGAPLEHDCRNLQEVRRWFHLSVFDNCEIRRLHVSTPGQGSRSHNECNGDVTPAEDHFNTVMLT